MTARPSILRRLLLSTALVAGAAALTSPAEAQSKGSSSDAAGPRRGGEKTSEVSETQDGEFSWSRGGGEAIYWRKSWTKFESTHGWFSGAALTTALVVGFIGPDRKLRKPLKNDLDEGIRDRLRGNSNRKRQFANDLSDVLLAVNTTNPFFGDAAITALWYRDSPDAAANMALISGETFAVLAAFHTTSNLVASRERPYGRECETDGDVDPNSNRCRSSRRYRSFFSGHSSFSFAGASLTCVHHLELQILGGGNIEAVPCGLAYAAAVTTAGARVVGDQHYFSDVATGALMGTAIGLGVPLLLHYRDDSPRMGRKGVAKSPEVARSHFSIQVMPTPRGLQVGGTF